MTRNFLVLAVALVSSLGAAQTASPQESALKQRLNGMAPAPTDQHKVLEAFVGKFDERTEIKLGPTMALHAHSIGEGKWVLGGRFVQFDSASAPDEEMKGSRLILWGYDPASSKYTCSNYETGALVPTNATGDYDAATKTFTFAGDMTKSGATFPFKVTLAIGEKGEIVQTISIQSPGQTDFSEVAKVTRTPVK